MQKTLDKFGIAVSDKRKKLNLTQQQLADKLNMCVRTIIQIEKGHGNPKFETLEHIAKELNVSIDAVIFPDVNPNVVSKSVIDFFADKTEEEIKKYIALCEQADSLSQKEDS